MPKEKTPSKQSDNPLPKNLLKKKRVSKEADKVESDDDEELDIEEEAVSKSKAKPKPNPEKELVKHVDLELDEKKQDEVPNINLVPDPIDNPKLEIAGHKILNSTVIIEYYDENGKYRTVNMTKVQLPNFTDMLLKYTSTFRMSKVDKAKLLEKWESLNTPVKSLKPSEDGTDGIVGTKTYGKDFE